MSRRGVLKAAAPSHDMHPGLWLDRYVADFNRPATEHLLEMFEPPRQDGSLRTPICRPPQGYAEFQQRLENDLRLFGPCTLLADANCRGRMAVGLGGETVLETGISLHRTWGVPYIPGSALKGLAARAARQELENGLDPSVYQLLFGALETAGYVTFHDALWKCGKNLPLVQDVMTVHHRDYYGWSGADELEPPADWDEPVPIPFLSAFGIYRLALTGPEGWVQTAFEILKGALENDGIGAKTAAGYGRMTVKEPEHG